MNNSENLKLILEKIKSSGKLDIDALDQLSAEEKQLIIDLYNEDLLDEASDFIDDIDVDKDWSAVKEKLSPPSPKKVVPIWKSMAKYAAVFIVLIASVYFFKLSEKAQTGKPISEEVVKLKIGDKTVELTQNGETRQIFSPSGKLVGEQTGNKILYNADAEVDELVYNELVIPYGKVFDVELSDGTTVHLNSGSNFRYPIKFLKEGNRDVFIDGEAYFKVAKNKDSPFIVNADAVEVKVLGTEFNVSSYKEDSEITTVLVEGSVSMTNSVVSGDNVLLEPGYKATWNKIEQNTKKEKVDVALFTAWTKGELIFRNSTFENILEKLERSYNVTIQDNNLTLKDKKFNARFNVNVETIEDILKSIQKIDSFEYKIVGKNLIIN